MLVEEKHTRGVKPSQYRSYLRQLANLAWLYFVSSHAQAHRDRSLPSVHPLV